MGFALPFCGKIIHEVVDRPLEVLAHIIVRLHCRFRVYHVDRVSMFQRLPKRLNFLLKRSVNKWSPVAGT